MGYDPSAQQVFASRDLCGHSMTDLPAMPENPFWRTFANLTLAPGEDLSLQLFVDGEPQTPTLWSHSRVKFSFFGEEGNVTVRVGAKVSNSLKFSANSPLIVSDVDDHTTIFESVEDRW